MKKLILFFSALFFLFSFKDLPHPYHVGSVDIRYNNASKTFEITGRFFLDDLEQSLSTKFAKPLHFNDKKYEAALQESLKKYCAEYFKMKSNNEFLKINFIGYEEENEGVNIYMESEPVFRPQKVEAAISFLYNIFDDQINLVHITINGERKSEKLTYPNRYLYQQF